MKKQFIKTNQRVDLEGLTVYATSNGSQMFAVVFNEPVNIHQMTVQADGGDFRASMFMNSSGDPISSRNNSGTYAVFTNINNVSSFTLNVSNGTNIRAIMDDVEYAD